MRVTLRAALALGLAAAAILASGCGGIYGSYSNIVDPGSSSYQGYISVTDMGSFALCSPADGASLAVSSSSPARLVAAALSGAAEYQFQVASSSSFAAAGILLDEDTTSNILSVANSSLENGAPSYWRARVEKGGSWSSWTASRNFTASGGSLSVSDTVSAPAFSPLGGTYFSGQEISISSTTSGASIYYTTDGTDPTGSSILYAGPVALTSAGGTTSYTLKAVAIKSGMKASDVSSAVYAIQRAIGLEGPQDVSISVSGPATIDFGSSGTFTATAAVDGTAAAMDSFAWYLDGDLVSGQTSSSIAISADSSSGGSHRLAVIATLDGYYYSGEATYTAIESAAGAARASLMSYR